MKNSKRKTQETGRVETSFATPSLRAITSAQVFDYRYASHIDLGSMEHDPVNSWSSQIDWRGVFAIFVGVLVTIVAYALINLDCYGSDVLKELLYRWSCSPYDCFIQILTLIYCFVLFGAPVIWGIKKD